MAADACQLAYVNATLEGVHTDLARDDLPDSFAKPKVEDRSMHGRSTGRQ